MQDVVTIASPQDLNATLADAAAAGHRLNIRAGASKESWGAPVVADRIVDLRALSGISLYEPEELVMTAAAGTTIREIEMTLAQRNQRLAFEPPDFGPLLGEAAERATIGGIFACNLAGPRRLSAGAARDHLLGFEAVNGLGDSFKSGGRVMKNVTGFDLCKLMAGSFGTLAVMSQVSFKVLPAAEECWTVGVEIPDVADGVRALTTALRMPMEVSGAAYIPAALSPDGRGEAFIRLEGTATSVDYRAQALSQALADFGPLAIIETTPSRTLWRQIRDVSYFGPGLETQVWRISVAPTAAAGLATDLADRLKGRFFLDWGGGQIWLEIPACDDAAHDRIRAAVATQGGHATLIRATQDVRSVVPVFQPQNSVLRALAHRLKAAFDPHGILNTGRRGGDV